MVGLLLMLVMLVLTPAPGATQSEQALVQNWFCPQGQSPQLKRGKITNDPGGYRMEAGCCGVGFEMLVSEKIVLCCELVDGIAAHQCYGTNCVCKSGTGKNSLGQKMTIPTTKAVTRTKSGEVPADADKWPVHDSGKAQAKTIDMWCPTGYLLYMFYESIVNDNGGKYAGDRVVMMCCKEGSHSVNSGDIFMCCPWQKDGKDPQADCNGNRCKCKGGVDAHLAIAPMIKTISEKEDCGQDDCQPHREPYRKKDNVLVEIEIDEGEAF